MTRPLLTALVPAAVGSYLAFGAATWVSPAPGDFYQMWVGARAAAAMDLRDLYSARDRARIRAAYHELAEQSGSERIRAGDAYWRGIPVFELAGTPVLYSGVALLSSPDFDASYTRFRLTSLAAFVFGVAALAWLAGYGLAAGCLAVAAATAAYPFRLDVQEGNVGQLQLGALAAVLVLHRTGWRANAAFVLALLVAFKPTLLPVAALLGVAALRERRTLGREAVAVSLAAAVAFELPARVLGDEVSWSGWLAGHGAIIGGYQGSALLGHYAGPLPPSVYALVGAGLIAVSGHVRDRLALAGAGCCVALLSSPLVHGHYWILAIPAALHALRPGAPYRPLAAPAALLLALPQWDLGLAWPDHYHGLPAFVAAAVLLGCAAWEARMRARRPPTGPR